MFVRRTTKIGRGSWGGGGIVQKRGLRETGIRLKRYTKSKSPGHGWYEQYKTEGPDSFRRWQRPQPFDFEAGDAKVLANRSHCFFEVGVDGISVGRVEFELLDEILPVTCENFKLLCTGTAPSGFRYKGSHFIRLVVRGNSSIMGGDVATEGGSHSAWKQRYFADEGFYLPHSEAGILTLANAGIDTNGSQFYITLKECPHLDGRCVAFGRVSSGLDLINDIIREVYTQRGVPTKPITILDTGLVDKPYASSASSLAA